MSDLPIKFVACGYREPDGRYLALFYTVRGNLGLVHEKSDVARHRSFLELFAAFRGEEVFGDFRDGGFFSAAF